MKKIMAIALSMILLLGFSACGESGSITWEDVTVGEISFKVDTNWVSEEDFEAEDSRMYIIEEILEDDTLASLSVYILCLPETMEEALLIDQEYLGDFLADLKIINMESFEIGGKPAVKRKMIGENSNGITLVTYSVYIQCEEGIYRFNFGMPKSYSEENDYDNIFEEFITYIK